MINEQKYELIRTNRKSLFRVKALKDFGDFMKVKKGDLGGYVESKFNLSQENDCWVAENATITENATIKDNALVFENARVSGKAHIFGNAQVFGNSRIFGQSRISMKACVFGNALIHGNSWVHGNANIYGNSEFSGNEQVANNAHISNKTLNIDDEFEEYKFFMNVLNHQGIEKYMELVNEKLEKKYVKNT
ncbi:MAG: hypothetical protein COA52_01105 [Hyphomicrobiales bacterium]|nr:MAG: hypothetical protein COA52_00015 [Hyphomicrobiales bacterium]PCJ96838.1 MAG: hypothetical protein COA52_01105 [Hyphomicrobiales bacterium]